MKPIEIQDLQNTNDIIREKGRKNRKPLYDSSEISKFSSANLSLDKPVMIKNKNSIDIVYSKDIVLIEASYSEGGKSALVMRD